MTFEGHNKKWDDSACLALSGRDIDSIVNETSVSCRWWKENGKEWEPCHHAQLRQPNSWIISNGLCTVVRNEECDSYHDIGQTYGWRGKGNCQDRKSGDPEPFGSMRCYVG